MRLHKYLDIEENVVLSFEVTPKEVTMPSPTLGLIATLQG